MRVHLDADALVYALSVTGPERRRVVQLAESEAEIQMSAIAWYEFSRGPRTPEQLAVARSFLFEDGIVPFSEDLGVALIGSLSNSRLSAETPRGYRHRSHRGGNGCCAPDAQCQRLRWYPGAQDRALWIRLLVFLFNIMSLIGRCRNPATNRRGRAVGTKDSQAW